MKKSLDLGSGQSPRNPFNADEVFGVDIVKFPQKNIVHCDLVINPIPFPDSNFDYVTAYDFIEHFPRLLYYKKKRSQPFIELMNEIWRVLKPGGILKAHTPAYPKSEAFVDPTHVNFISENTVDYFCGGEYTNLSKSYGFLGMFEKISVRWDEEWEYHLIWEIAAIK